MRKWRQNPIIYEINTWVWLAELSRKAGRPLTLASVPDTQWDRIASLGFDAVWLMGVWQRSPAGIGISMANESLCADFKKALPDFREHDNVGSPYCVRSYTVDAHLGGNEALSKARTQLARRGLQLILDFVPNHVAPDHAWLKTHPEYFIQASRDDLENDPRAFASIAGRVYACGRDPYFPAWPDVIQVNAFNDGLRSAVIETLSTIAGQCDGIRCDMAMLLTSAVFEKTWSSLAGSRPPEEYWREIIPEVKRKYPEFRFIAEVYWDMEWELQQQGFDYCYDKRLYDRLEHGSGESIHLHLDADLAYQHKLLRFIENHDEPRAAAAFSPQKHRAAAITALTLPGARLIHEGQMEGRTIRLPVFLARRPAEPPDPELQNFYRTLLTALRDIDFDQGDWRICELSGWPDNPSHLNLVAWCWKAGRTLHLIAVNLSGDFSQGLVHVPVDDLRGRSWRLHDPFSNALYERDGDEMCGSGLYVDLAPWGFHYLKLLE